MIAVILNPLPAPQKNSFVIWGEKPVKVCNPTQQS